MHNISVIVMVGMAVAMVIYKMTMGWMEAQTTFGAEGVYASLCLSQMKLVE